jgi:hypothetical protein
MVAQDEAFVIQEERFGRKWGLNPHPSKGAKDAAPDTRRSERGCDTLAWRTELVAWGGKGVGEGVGAFEG